MNSNPKISVIIPVYNTGLPLRCCLDSIAQQTYRNLEIILVDDGSSDGSERACDEYAAKDVRFKVIHQKNAGVSNARNAGLAIATGDYFQFPDSDDYLELDSYEYLLGLFEKHQCDVVNFEYYVTFSNHEKRHHLSEENYGLVDRKRAHEIVWNGESFACNKLYKATFVTGKDIDWNNTSPLAPVKFRPDIYRGEDSLFVHFQTECFS
ncbi:MAG: glycosyltransferase, partial [Sphingobacteriia bacterium]|nr:glycosyltransferase [Sphingobacteriia bacterium]